MIQYNGNLTWDKIITTATCEVEESSSINLLFHHEKPPIIHNQDVQYNLSNIYPSIKPQSRIFFRSLNIFLLYQYSPSTNRVNKEICK